MFYTINQMVRMTLYKYESARNCDNALFTLILDNFFDGDILEFYSRKDIVGFIKTMERERRHFQQLGQFEANEMIKIQRHKKTKYYKDEYKVSKSKQSNKNLLSSIT